MSNNTESNTNTDAVGRGMANPELAVYEPTLQDGPRLTSKFLEDFSDCKTVEDNPGYTSSYPTHQKNRPNKTCPKLTLVTTFILATHKTSSNYATAEKETSTTQPRQEASALDAEPASEDDHSSPCSALSTAKGYCPFHSKGMGESTSCSHYCLPHHQGELQGDRHVQKHTAELQDTGDGYA